jgi:hypothetical protein
VAHELASAGERSTHGLVDERERERERERDSCIVAADPRCCREQNMVVAQLRSRHGETWNPMDWRLYVCPRASPNTVKRGIDGPVQ